MTMMHDPHSFGQGYDHQSIISGQPTTNIIKLHNFNVSNSFSPFLIDGNIERLRHVITEDEQAQEKDVKIQNIVNSNHEEVMNSHKRILEELDKSRSDHERLEAQIVTLSEDIAKKEDLIVAKEEIIKKVYLESQELQRLTKEKIDELKSTLEDFLPHKRTFKVSLYFMILFSACFFATLLTGISIITPFWNFLGIYISCGFILLSFALHKDWKNTKESNNG